MTHPRFIVEADDWIEQLSAPFRAECLDTIRGLSLGHLQRFPQPKDGGLPFGREISVLSRYLTGRCAVFEPSGLARAYAWTGTARERLLSRGFVLGDTLPRHAWIDIIGQAAFARWRDHHLFRDADGGHALRFRVYGIGPVAFLADPPGSNLLRRVIAGQDSLNLVEFLIAQRLPRVSRYLDVGPGSGVVLLSIAPLADEALGLDINPRAVAISRLNVELNQLDRTSVLEGDIFTDNEAQGRFDRITWNTPFMLFPPECKDTHYDAFGGEMGIELQLNFIRRLPALLAENGRALLSGTSTVLDNGDNLMNRALPAIASDGGLDIGMIVLRNFYTTAFPEYQRACGVDHFESVFFDIRPGRGRFRRIDAPFGTRLLDGLRGALYGLDRRRHPVA